MACRSCSTADGGVPKGCKSNGSCGTGGCGNKLEVFDWLSNMQPANPAEQFQWVEVRFKNSRKEFYYNKTNLPVYVGDLIAVEGSPGHDIGTVSMTGELVKLQMKKTGFNYKTAEGRAVYRKARENDIQKWKEAIDKEQKFMMFCRKTSKELGLEMKCSDVESQGDGSKATFYYTSEGRVDFRELIKILARDLKVRIEMRQIGFRQEAGRLGGIGVCGRELCCSTWMRDFRSVTTSAARYQQLSINPQKLAGQCGKLKCCLNYELDSYLDALSEFPNTQIKLKTKIGDASHFKTDIFKKQVSYTYDNAPGVIIPLDILTIQKVMKMNKDGVFPDDLQSLIEERDRLKNPIPKKQEFANVLDEMNLSRFDNANKSKNNNNKNRKKKKRNGNIKKEQK
jgi:cell fate regulator YaaT (PSP1 superfamily)